MTDLTTASPRPPAQSSARPTRQQTVSHTLKAIRDLHLSLWTDYSALLADFTARCKADHWQGQFLALTFHRHFQPETESERHRQIGYLTDFIVHQPEIRFAKALFDRMDKALDHGFNEAQARVIVGVMVDAFPNARPHSPEAYVETIVHELQAKGVPTAAIAKGCNAIVTSQTFLPAASEVLEKVQASLGMLKSFHRQLGRFVEWSKTATAAIAWFETVDLWDRVDGVDRLAFDGNEPA